MEHFPPSFCCKLWSFLFYLIAMCEWETCDARLECQLSVNLSFSPSLNQESHVLILNEVLARLTFLDLYLLQDLNFVIYFQVKVRLFLQLLLANCLFGLFIRWNDVNVILVCSLGISVASISQKVPSLAFLLTLDELFKRLLLNKVVSFKRLQKTFFLDI